MLERTSRRVFASVASAIASSPSARATSRPIRPLSKTLRLADSRASQVPEKDPSPRAPLRGSNGLLPCW
ncbi:hypothetical protein D3C78_1911800 [compost metagenome]